MTKRKTAVPTEPKKPSKQVELEDMFYQQLVEAGLPLPCRQYRSHPKRRFLSDFAWPDISVIAELEGGTWMQTRTGRGKGHAHPIRFEKDCEKYNALTLIGWRILRYTGKMVKDGRAIAQISEVLRGEPDVQ